MTLVTCLEGNRFGGGMKRLNLLLLETVRPTSLILEG